MNNIGFDIGSGFVGYSAIIVRPGAESYALDDYGTIEVGHMAQLDKPRKHGKNTVTHERVIDDDDLLTFRSHLSAILTPYAHGISAKTTRVTIERSIRVYPRGRLAKQGGIDSTSATCIANTQWIGGEIAALAAFMGLRVITADATTIRQATVGKRSAEDSEIKSWVIGKMGKEWPKVSNAHERDSAVAALYGAELHQ